MAIVKKSLTTTPVAISTAGQSGTAWMKEGPDGDSGQAYVLIYHTDSGTPSLATMIDLGKRLFTPIGNEDVMKITANSGSDIYYACCKNTGDTADILVDVV